MKPRLSNQRGNAILVVSSIYEVCKYFEPTHNPRFTAFMEQFMPKWQFYQEILNRLPVHHE